MNGPMIGHNNGPPLDYERKSRHRARLPSHRLKRAEELGMSDKDSAAIILDTGVRL